MCGMGNVPGECVLGGEGGRDVREERCEGGRGVS